MKHIAPVTREEFDALAARYAALEERVTLQDATIEDLTQRSVGLSHDVNAIQKVIADADTGDEPPKKKK